MKPAPHWWMGLYLLLLPEKCPTYIVMNSCSVSELIHKWSKFPKLLSVPRAVPGPWEVFSCLIMKRKNEYILLFRNEIVISYIAICCLMCYKLIVTMKVTCCFMFKFYTNFCKKPCTMSPWNIQLWLDTQYTINNYVLILWTWENLKHYLQCYFWVRIWVRNILCGLIIYLFMRLNVYLGL